MQCRVPNHKIQEQNFLQFFIIHRSVCGISQAYSQLVQAYYLKKTPAPSNQPLSSYIELPDFHIFFLYLEGQALFFSSFPLAFTTRPMCKFSWLLNFWKYLSIFNDVLVKSMHIFKYSFEKAQKFIIINSRTNQDLSIYFLCIANNI